MGTHNTYINQQHGEIMSHFTVMVFGNNQEAQLAPYHEFECTGQDDEFVQEVSFLDEILADQARLNYSVQEVAEYHGYENSIYTSELEAEQNLDGKAKFGYLIEQDGKIVKAVRRTNPNAKWDWYQLGGRWRGFFKAKPGVNGQAGTDGWSAPQLQNGHFDLLRKGDIDVEGMVQDAMNEAYAEYDKAMQIADGRELPSWKEIRERHGNEGIDAARSEYNSNPVIQDFNAADLRFWNDSPGERYGMGREEFARRRASGVIMPYAFIYDGEWYAKGEMGWWGMSTDDMTQEQWNDKFMELFNSLPDDTLVGLYDCHI